MEVYGGVWRGRKLEGGIGRGMEVYGGVWSSKEVYGGAGRGRKVYGVVGGGCMEVYGGVGRCREVYGVSLPFRSRSLLRDSRGDVSSPLGC